MANFIAEDFKRIFKGNNYLAILILVNACVFVLVNIILAVSSDEVGLLVLTNIGLPAGLLNSLTHFWTFFTYMFVHEGFRHILFNMLLLYWFGRILADIYGQKRVLQTYLYGGIAGGIIFVLASIIPNIPIGSFLIGASAGVLAVVVATGTLLPNYQLNLLLIGPVKLKYLALVCFILSTVLDINQNFGGKAAHMGGALYGLIYGMQLSKGVEITDGLNRFFAKIISLFNRKPKMRVVHNKNKKSTTAGKYQDLTSTEKQHKTDEILDKISKSGYDSLTKEEKDFLFKVSNR